MVPRKLSPKVHLVERSEYIFQCWLPLATVLHKRVVILGSQSLTLNSDGPYRLAPLSKFSQPLVVSSIVFKHLHQSSKTENNMEDLEVKLRSEKIWHRFIEKPETVHTADASRASGVDLRRLTKNLVLSCGSGEYCLVIVPGNSKIDLKKVSKLLGVSNVSLVPFDQAEEISGYPPGGTPSIFHKARLRTVIDRSLMDHETLFCGGGARDRILELKVDDVIRLDEALVADVLKA